MFDSVSGSRRGFYMGRMKRRIERFCREEDGIITIETLCIIPLMMSVMMIMFMFWDAYRSKTVANTANYVIADIISRENFGVTDNFINGMHRVYRSMIDSNDRTAIRVSSIGVDPNTEEYTVLWSVSTDEARYPVLTTNGAMDWLTEITPELDTGSTLILVESWQDFTPLARPLIDTTIFYSRNFVWPRILSPLPYTSS